jgi:aldehyde:ferredoxin oxidoreductase
MKSLGVLEPLPVADLSPEKVRLYTYFATWRNTLNCLLLCVFPHYDYNQTSELVSSVTDWNTSLWELMKLGERAVQMTRAFNVREGFSKKDDNMPKRFFTPFKSGPLEGVGVDKAAFEQAKETYYRMMDWEDEKGAPSRERLSELGIGWVADKL